MHHRYPEGHAPKQPVLPGALRCPRDARLSAAIEAAVGAAGLDGPKPRLLKRAAASLAIAAGADVKMVQQTLGHRSATMTLDLYSHLFADQLDDSAKQ
jgi:integrase